jgi:hypothetical protein
MGRHGSLVCRDDIQSSAQRFPDIGGGRIPIEIQNAHFEKNIGAALAYEIRVGIAGRSVMKIVQVGVRFPGSENLLDRQTVGIDAGPVGFSRNAGYFPFDAVFLSEPLAAVHQQSGKSPSDISESDECKIYLLQFLFHPASVCKVWPDGDITSCSVGLQ